MPWGAAIIGGAMVGGALISSDAASSAADSQAEGTAKGLAENARQFDITQANQAPYLAAGKTALSTLAAENDVAFDPSKVQMDPGYQFGLQQGRQAIDRQAAAGGGRISGAALKAAAQFGTDYATTGYSAAYSRANQARTDRLNRLAALAGVGQTATQNIGALGAQTAGANSALMVAAGNNAGAAQLAQGNIWGNAGNQIAALYGRGAGAGSSRSDGMGTGNNYSYTPDALPVDTGALQDMSWMNYGSGG
jgi:hypothetical protein